MFFESQHNIKHDELRRDNHSFFVIVLTQYFSRVKPSKISVLICTMLNLIQIVKIFLILTKFEEINVFVFFER